MGAFMMVSWPLWLAGASPKEAAVSGTSDLRGRNGPSFSWVLGGQLSACRRCFSLPGNDERSLKLRGSAIASAP